ncbi:MAG TPA: hypothetical protein H9743_00545 [Candidatus Mediterraneibacter vanvlietii]|nr:hypothetical protein [Candidatus Mediterraneibacter vanvlietii]
MDMIINEQPLIMFGARMQMNYTYTPPTLSNEYFKGRQRSTFTLLMSNYDLGSLKVPLVFEGIDHQDVSFKKSGFDGAIFGMCDIEFSDGFRYFAFPDTLGDADYQSESLIESEYIFKCIRHGVMKTSVGNSVLCESTLPYTDCILSVTVGAASDNYVVGPVTFQNVSAGDQLVVDGINKRILVNGSPAADQADWIRFPYMTPGQNSFTCVDTLTIQYYPVYF